MHVAKSGEEYALSFESGGRARVLVIPALFDEANKLRRFTIDTMRALSAAGVDCVLPDFPGCNESLAPLSSQTLTSWREAACGAAAAFGASHVLTIRGGALIDPGSLPAIAFAPVAGASVLRGMLRAAVLREREAGREATREGLLEQGQRGGLVLAGYPLSEAMLAQLEGAEPAAAVRTIAQSELGGPALWLRAEPADDPAQSAALAALVSAAL